MLRGGLWYEKGLGAVERETEGGGGGDGMGVEGGGVVTTDVVSLCSRGTGCSSDDRPAALRPPTTNQSVILSFIIVQLLTGC